MLIYVNPRNHTILVNLAIIQAIHTIGMAIPPGARGQELLSRPELEVRNGYPARN